MKKEYPVANPMVVHRREMDNWAVLFDPDANETYALDPVASLIWEKLDGEHTRKDILSELGEDINDELPDEAVSDLDEFLEQLESKALVGFEK